MSLHPEGKFSDGVPITAEECIACEHPDLRTQFGLDGE